MTDWTWTALGVGGAIGVLAWLQRVIRTLRRDLSRDQPPVSESWRAEYIRNRR